MSNCPEVDGASGFNPEANNNTRLNHIAITSFTLVILVIVYSCNITIQTNQTREEYAKALFSDFTIIEAEDTEISQYYRDGFFVAPIHFFDAEEFINVAHQQDVKTLYRVIPSPDGFIYYYFESPIYNENYRVYENEITPPVRYVSPRFGLPEIVLERTG